MQKSITTVLGFVAIFFMVLFLLVFIPVILDGGCAILDWFYDKLVTRLGLRIPQSTVALALSITMLSVAWAIIFRRS